jgi:hypothetical protein
MPSYSRRDDKRRSTRKHSRSRESTERKHKQRSSRERRREKDRVRDRFNINFFSFVRIFDLGLEVFHHSNGFMHLQMWHVNLVEAV